ncbi:MAG: cytochrome P450 [Gammaproteobacteria bacterium]|nr:cytochrome P450 [Gammaproteobacteria bacterium]
MTTEAIRAEYAEDISLAELEADPYPIFRRLQQEKPLAWVEKLGMWLVTRYPDVMHVVTNPELFTAETEPSFLADVLGVNMLTLEGEEARRIKSAMQPPFTARGCAKDYIDNELEDIAHALIDEFISDGEVELMTRYAEPVSTVSLQRCLGLDNIPRQRMWELCEGVCAGLANFEGDPALDAVYQKARDGIEEIVREKIAAVREQPDSSAIAYYVAPERGLTDEEITNNVRLMISGGINEPRDGIGMAIYAFQQHHQRSEDARLDRSFWLRFTNEVLRLYAPVGTAARMTTTPTRLAGVELPAGEFIAACLSAANRDAGFWEQPDEFLPGRKQKDHVAFSQGQHRCLGLWLGLHEIIVGASLLVERIPNLQLDTTRPPTISGFEFRGPKTLHLRW